MAIYKIFQSLPPLVPGLLPNNMGVYNPAYPTEMSNAKKSPYGLRDDFIVEWPWVNLANLG